jgi:serine protease Do
MTFGIISALGRTLPVRDGTMMSATRYTIPDIIQTDAPVNPGNSGGALLDLQGRLIGVPTAIESSTRSSAGVGFAVPSVIVQKVVPELISKGSYEHPYLGVSGTTLTSQLAVAMDLPASQRGALVVEVTNDGPADKAGLRGSAKQAEIDGQEVPVGGDIIIAVEGQPVRDFEDVTTYLTRNGRVGQDITLTLLRDGEETTLTVTLAARPSAQRTTEQPRQPMMARAWLGINGATLTADLAEAMDLDAAQEGVLILNVVNGSPADEAGLRGGFRALNLNGERLPIGGDVIVAVDGEDMTTMVALVELVAGKEPGDTVTLTILRDGEQSDVTVTLGERPAQQ